MLSPGSAPGLRPRSFALGVCLAGLLFSASAPAHAAAFDHSVWDRILKTYVNELGEVDYRALKANRRDLDGYVRSLGEVSPTNKPEL